MIIEMKESQFINDYGIVETCTESRKIVKQYEHCLVDETDAIDGTELQNHQKEVSYLDHICQEMNKVLCKYHVYSVENIPESLLKQVIITGDTTDLESYLNERFCIL